MLSDEQKAKLKDLLGTDLTLKEIAGELGMAYNTFRVRLAESGLRIARVLEDTRASEPIQTVPATQGVTA